MRPAAALAAALCCITAPGLSQSVCDGRPIREIRITTQSLFGIEDEPFPPFVQRLANSLHWRTRPRMVARDLLFRAGTPCDPLRLAEAERLLRAQGYIRTASVTPLAAPGGAVDVEVLTRDDWTIDGSISYDPTRSGRALRRLRLSEDNVLGRGMRAEFRYRHTGRDPGFEVEVIERHFVRGRRDAAFILGQSGMGPVAEQTITRSFESEFDRNAWRESSRHRREPFMLTDPLLGVIGQRVVTIGGDLGFARRFGDPGKLRLLGIALTGERREADAVVEAPRSTDDSAASAQLAGRFRERRVLRANVMLGARILRFSQAAGFDAVNALEDVREGIEVGFIAGRSFGGGDFQDDWFAAGEVFAGLVAGDRARLFVRGKAEGRWLFDENAWDGVIASGQLLAYGILTPRSVVVLALTGSGGWHTSSPFQMQLAGPSGVRGYGHSSLPVGRRVVAQAEQRYFLGTLFGAVDIGTAGFADVGRGWAGDAPFASSIGTVASVGAGVRLAFPSGSRRVYRLDLAIPTTRGAGPELRVGFGQQFGISRGEADDVSRSRETISSATIFNFPRF